MTGFPGNILNIVSCVHMVSWGISGEIHLNESEDDRMGQGEKHVLHVVAAKTPPYRVVPKRKGGQGFVCQCPWVTGGPVSLRRGCNCREGSFFAAWGNAQQRTWL